MMRATVTETIREKEDLRGMLFIKCRFLYLNSLLQFHHLVCKLKEKISESTRENSLQSRHQAACLSYWMYFVKYENSLSGNELLKDVKVGRGITILMEGWYEAGFFTCFLVNWSRTSFRAESRNVRTGYAWNTDNHGHFQVILSPKAPGKYPLGSMFIS